MTSNARAFLCFLAERIVIRIRHGKLILHAPTETYVFPDCVGNRTDVDCTTASLRIRSSNFFLRLLLAGDLGFAEAYMFNEVDISADDLVRTFLIFMKNKTHLSGLADPTLTKLLALPVSILTRLASPLASLTGLSASKLANALVDARANISAHYDLGNEMFKGFLSEDMTYSCAIFPTLDADIGAKSLLNTPNMSSCPSTDGFSTPSSSETIAAEDEQFSYAKDDLHNAQMAKLRHIIHKADIQPGHRVLEIGSGWGSLSLMITQTIPDTVVDTITLSEQQREYVLAKIEEAASGCELGDNCTHKLCDTGLKQRLRVHLMDYRTMPAEWKGAFDRVVSVEMVEAVGREYLTTYFSSIDWALKKDCGVGVVQGITIPESRYEEYTKSEDFIRKWVIFPGGILPTVTQLTSTLSLASQYRLVVESVENIGPHYARTLREWRRRFEGAFGEGGTIEEALKQEHPDTMDGPDGKEAIEVFRRKWIYYFCYCEAGFTSRWLGDHIVTFTREGNSEYGCQVYR